MDRVVLSVPCPGVLSAVLGIFTVWRCFMGNALGLGAQSVVFPGLRVVLWDIFGCVPALYVDFAVVGCVMCCFLECEMVFGVFLKPGCW